VNERAFQTELRHLCEQILNGTSRVRRIVVDCTPGGGKSTVPMIVAARLAPARLDKICWVVPRRTLAQQAATDFADAAKRALFGQRGEIRWSTNDVNPSRGHAGFVTTYQAIADRPGAVPDEVSGRGRRYAVVLDETQHVWAGGPWARVVQPLVDGVPLLVQMSGGLERGDRERIAFLDDHYQDVPGGVRLVLRADEETAVIRYTRQDALRERAIKPIRFYHLDGQFEWISAEGDARALDSLKGADREESAAAIFTALSTDYARDLLLKCIASWEQHRRVNPRAKMLVVAHSIARARSYLEEVKRQGVARVAVAASDESAEAQEAIRRYKLPHDHPSAHDALVTVAMAYEGLDAAQTTHLACLTHIRSKPWIEQMIGRVSRHDYGAGPWELQAGVIFGPDDPPLNTILGQILAEQAPFIPDSGAHGPGSGPKERNGHIIPVVGAVTAAWVRDLSGGRGITQSRLARLERAAARNGIQYGGDPVRLEEFFQEVEGAGDPAGQTDRAAPRATPHERELAVKRAIENRCRQLDHRDGLAPGTWNRRVLERFGKPRPDMTEEQLQAVWAWLEQIAPENVRGS